MPAPQLHLTFGSMVKDHPDVHPMLRRACAAEPVYTRLGAIFHDLPYYGNMLIEAIRYGMAWPALDEPWSYRMHSVQPARFVASYIRAAATTTSLGRDEGLALVGGLVSHCALDLTLHPLVNYCARRDTTRWGGHESFHHRVTEKYHALFFHLEHLGHDPIGTAEFRRSTRIVKERTLTASRVEQPILTFVQSAYQGTYGNSPSAWQWSRWVRNFYHFGVLVGSPLAASNSRRVRHNEEHRLRYYENEVFSFPEFFAASQKRLGQVANLCFDYFMAGDFSAAAEDAFVERSTMDDLAEPRPIALPDLPQLQVRCTPGGTRPPLQEPTRLTA